MDKKIKVVVTGVTGMVGEGVMHECLLHPDVEEVHIISRRAAGHSHPKLKSSVHENMADISAIKNQLAGYDACFFCLGVSSVGMKEDEYTKLTYDLTLGFAKTMAEVNPNCVFTYVSGAYTDSTEKGKSMWARVKGRTENDLLKLFANGYMFRPGYMQPTPGLKYTLKYYKYISWMYPILKTFFPGAASTLADLGRSMLYVAFKGYNKRVLEVKDIKLSSKQLN
jgi:uncharacterized protein YbjT (DUF2867 family)